MNIKLQYVGKVNGINHLNIDPRMWNVISFPSHRELERSTRMIEGLIELGVIPERKVV